MALPWRREDILGIGNCQGREVIVFSGVLTGELLVKWIVSTPMPMWTSMVKLSASQSKTKQNHVRWRLFRRNFIVLYLQPKTLDELSYLFCWKIHTANAVE